MGATHIGLFPGLETAQGWSRRTPLSSPCVASIVLRLVRGLPRRLGLALFRIAALRSSQCQRAALLRADVALDHFPPKEGGGHSIQYTLSLLDRQA